MHKTGKRKRFVFPGKSLWPRYFSESDAISSASEFAIQVFPLSRHYLRDNVADLVQEKGKEFW
jgi:hypothetical protein